LIARAEVQNGIGGIGRDSSRIGDRASFGERVAARVTHQNVRIVRAYVLRVDSLRALVDAYHKEITMLEQEIHALLKDDRSYMA
jgi:cell division protein FtsB